MKRCKLFVIYFFSVSWTNDIVAIKELNKRKLTKTNATLNRHQIQMLFKWKKIK